MKNTITLDTTDLADIAAALETLAGLDEGENTDYDNLIRLRRLLLVQAERDFVYAVEHYTRMDFEAIDDQSVALIHAMRQSARSWILVGRGGPTGDDLERETIARVGNALSALWADEVPASQILAVGSPSRAGAFGEES